MFGQSTSGGAKTDCSWKSLIRDSNNEFSLFKEKSVTFKSLLAPGSMRYQKIKFLGYAKIIVLSMFDQNNGGKLVVRSM